ncbi:hypothetical protein GLOTRDRAFT_96241 [Gloeophyllum trabeum ATCC 11539]|uniref:Uncharacterized protein n=1 Tax=Gloeophyllum trabeum (strain ATCC 11539 / FP-39264 / Madison 617) TaxID=670483 RepID=S7PVG9_GLOTA|nr:uncharacterized protein GLOTRDRAFT_96241 [Gloeophyllum trabeum ATCC 11539]EPQ51483.1 hypothetical protein GLOTRDRAFT_96241 [Gloeophyllum trabeum ATCC 11539]
MLITLEQLVERAPHLASGTWTAHSHIRSPEACQFTGNQLPGRYCCALHPPVLYLPGCPSEVESLVPRRTALIVVMVTSNARMVAHLIPVFVMEPVGRIQTVWTTIPIRAHHLLSALAADVMTDKENTSPKKGTPLRLNVAKKRPEFSSEEAVESMLLPSPTRPDYRGSKRRVSSLSEEAGEQDEGGMRPLTGPSDSPDRLQHEAPPAISKLVKKRKVAGDQETPRSGLLPPSTFDSRSAETSVSSTVPSTAVAAVCEVGVTQAVAGPDESFPAPDAEATDNDSAATQPPVPAPSLVVPEPPAAAHMDDMMVYDTIPYIDENNGIWAAIFVSFPSPSIASPDNFYRLCHGFLTIFQAEPGSLRPADRRLRAAARNVEARRPYLFPDSRRDPARLASNDVPRVTSRVLLVFLCEEWLAVVSRPSAYRTEPWRSRPPRYKREESWAKNWGVTYLLDEAGRATAAKAYLPRGRPSIVCSDTQLRYPERLLWAPWVAPQTITEMWETMAQDRKVSSSQVGIRSNPYTGGMFETLRSDRPPQKRTYYWKPEQTPMCRYLSGRTFPGVKLNVHEEVVGHVRGTWHEFAEEHSESARLTEIESGEQALSRIAMQIELGCLLVFTRTTVWINIDVTDILLPNAGIFVRVALRYSRPSIRHDFDLHSYTSSARGAMPTPEYLSAWRSAVLGARKMVNCALWNDLVHVVRRKDDPTQKLLDKCLRAPQALARLLWNDRQSVWLGLGLVGAIPRADPGRAGP